MKINLIIISISYTSGTNNTKIRLYNILLSLTKKYNYQKNRN